MGQCCGCEPCCEDLCGEDGFNKLEEEREDEYAINSHPRVERVTYEENGEAASLKSGSIGRNNEVSDQTPDTDYNSTDNRRIDNIYVMDQVSPTVLRNVQPTRMDVSDESSSDENLDMVDKDDNSIKDEELEGFPPNISPMLEEVTTGTEKKLFAYVVENKNYKRKADIAPSNVDDICRVLTDFGFQVTRKKNLNDTELNSSFEDYSLKLSDTLGENDVDDSFLLFYYLGHSDFSVDEDDVSFIPIDLKEASSLSLSTVIDYSNNIDDSLKMMIIVDGKKTRKSNPLDDVDADDVVISYPFFWRAGVVADVIVNSLKDSKALDLKDLINRFKEHEFYVFSNLTKNVVFHKE